MQKKTNTAARPNKNLRIILIFLIVIALTTVFILGKKQLDPSENVDLAAAAKESQLSSPVIQENLETTVKKLEGNWQRSDGGYILILKDPTPDGKVNAEYFNPKPIKVGSSGWQSDAGKVTVKIELQDVNYPGSIYTLEYFPKGDILAGVYYQAVQKMNFDVQFDRIK